MAWRTDFVSENDFLSPIHIFQNCHPQGLSIKQDEVWVVNIRKDGKKFSVIYRIKDDNGKERQTSETFSTQKDAEKLWSNIT